MPLELVEVELSKEILHRLAYVCDARGGVKFRDRDTEKIYFQKAGETPGHAVWFAEKEA